jgi:hypothetical protein
MGTGVRIEERDAYALLSSAATELCESLSWGRVVGEHRDVVTLSSSRASPWMSRISASRTSSSGRHGGRPNDRARFQ